jgi:HptB-dependent secretion and biofilm anti anti-sigma factor
MRLQKNKSSDGTEVTISLPEKFDFQLHKEFRAAYEESNVKSLVLDMNKTQYMDSSALGMLLQLKEYTDKHNSEIKIKNASKNVMQIMQIAHFDKLFKVA